VEKQSIFEISWAFIQSEQVIRVDSCWMFIGGNIHRFTKFVACQYKWKETNIGLVICEKAWVQE
jgi:hypothetical protein